MITSNTRVFAPTPKEEKEYWDWVVSRPENVRRVAEKFDPWSLYRMKSTGHLVTLFSFNEAEDRVTVTVTVSGDYNLVVFERNVFGIDPDDLEPCEPPLQDENCGALLDQDEAREFLSRNARIEPYIICGITSEEEHNQENCSEPECSCYEAIGGHQMGCYFYGR